MNKTKQNKPDFYVYYLIVHHLIYHGFILISIRDKTESLTIMSSQIKYQSLNVESNHW